MKLNVNECIKCFFLTHYFFASFNYFPSNVVAIEMFSGVVNFRIFIFVLDVNICRKLCRIIY